MTEPAYALEWEELSLVFGERVVLRDFTLRVRSGERVVVAGRSGSGKTSLMRCLLGFQVPSLGTVRLEGRPLTPHSVWALRARLGVVAQEPDLGQGAVREALEQPFRFRVNASLRGRLAEAPALFERLRLPADTMAKAVRELSGGEKQRVALAVALLLDRPTLVLDEPLSALDPESRRAVLDELARSPGRTILALMHRAEDFPGAHRVVSLNGGGAS